MSERRMHFVSGKMSANVGLLVEAETHEEACDLASKALRLAYPRLPRTDLVELVDIHPMTIMVQSNYPSQVQALGVLDRDVSS